MGLRGYPPGQARYHHYFVFVLYCLGKFGYQAGADVTLSPFLAARHARPRAALLGEPRRRPCGEREDVVS